MSVCKDCIHYEICSPYVTPNESFPETDGGCKCFKDKRKLVEVVRCGECIYRTSNNQRCIGRRKDWFCANGERR